MNILLLSAGGGGGNILRSVKRLFRRDLAVVEKTDPRYAERLQRSIVTRFLDTNEFSLTDVPKDERVLIGAQTTRRLGSRHNPAVAAEALEESRQDVAALIAKYSVVIIIGTGGKGTGAGTILPLTQLAREQRKLVIPIFVRPSFERHEVEKPRYDHALRVVRGFDAAGVRLIEILNDCGYVDRQPQPQSVVWERMNLPIARALRGLLYVLSDLSQVDPSDLSLLFAGQGRLRTAFAEINPAAGEEPTDEQIQDAVRLCWDNPYYEFSRPVGTSLVCIQGDWSNVVDGRIKGRLATLALDGSDRTAYNPLYARAFQTPRPWGVTAVFAEHTGAHAPLDVDWRFERRALAPSKGPLDVKRAAATLPVVAEKALPPKVRVLAPVNAEPSPPALEKRAPVFARFWDLAFALQRADPEALAIASGDTAGAFAIEATEVRRLLATMWFPSVFQRLSQGWRNRILQILVDETVVPDHSLKIGRMTMRLSAITLDDLKDTIKKTYFPDAIQADLQLLVAVGNLWGPEAVKRLTFTRAGDNPQPSKLSVLLQAFR